jgi:hypothetical protein
MSVCTFFTKTTLLIHNDPLICELVCLQFDRRTVVDGKKRDRNRPVKTPFTLWSDLRIFKVAANLADNSDLV